MKKKLLWVGDAGCPSGFARVTHGVLDVVREVYDVTVLGINYRGDPHKYPYDIWAAGPGGDAFGVGRLIFMCDIVKPDVIVLLNDPWNVPYYIAQLQKFPEYMNIPVVASLAVDGKNLSMARRLNELRHAIFWTEFGLNEARAGGYTGEASVIPLGVDTSIFNPISPSHNSLRVKLKPPYDTAFLVGNVNRNQPRKRWDLTVRYFAEWLKSYKIEDACLYLHTAPTGDTGTDVQQLAQHYGVLSRLCLNEPAVHYGVTERQTAETYNLFDVLISTTQGEGMGLTALEAMSCGIPCILPDWAAFGDWAAESAYMVKCTSTAIGPPYINVLGGVADEEAFIIALNDMYKDKSLRAHYGQKGMELAHSDKFNWRKIALQYIDVLNEVVMYEDQVPQEVAS